jgi:ABC-2 type transport system ATP-binding protein
MRQANSAIHVSELCKRFRDIQALDGVSLDIQAGEFFGLLGPNGAGKTTLISILAGLSRADSGHAAIMGHDVVRDYRQARRALGVVPQELVYDPFFNVRETLHIQSGFFGLKHNDNWIDEIMYCLDLTQHADKNTQSLSGGMKRRLLVAQALVHKPPVIVLDEPTAGVDVDLRRSLWEFIKRLNREGHTILLTTHYLEEAQALCGRIAMLKSGRIVALDATRNLLQLTNEHCAQLRLDGETVPAAWKDRLLHDADGSWHINFSEYQDLEILLADLRGAGTRVLEMHLQEPDLEDVFTDIMKRS